MAGVNDATYHTVLYAWRIALKNPKIGESFFLTIRERSFQVLSRDRISSKRVATSSIVGRFDGSSCTISATNACRNSNP